YSPAPPPKNNATLKDDPYAFLSTFDTVFVIDDSYSMGTPVAGSRHRTYWDEARDAVEAITPICTAYDSNGIDIYFLNGNRSPFHHNVTSVSTVREIFSSMSPMGSTPTGQCLNKILKPYLDSYKAKKEQTKPINIIVITDGVPTDDDSAPLILAAKKLDQLEAPLWQIGVQFFQVGNDAGACEHLRRLDDDLKDLSGDPHMRDIVDTVSFKDLHGSGLTGDAILKVVLGAVNRRLDR
ncbi:uncharacterized protein K489DRAFT_304582, partial [Dissoconium aciculare CBS 342.82]|uniref:VWFA domain-containing protein n=1 Tax=Dissoconium aciculare CBS 342.82 TaxID=1314786 RepID=A0A6J3LXE0_9PEZI